MPRWRFLLLMVLTLAACTGCRTKPYVNTHIETVNAEYRQLEDYVYGLEDENARLTHELAALRTGTATGARPPVGGQPGGLLRRRLPGSAATDPATDPPVIEVPNVPSETPPRRSIRNKPSPADADIPLDLEPPTIELPAPREQKSAPDMPATPAAPEPLPATPADSKVTHLFLNPVMTGGVNLDSQPGDDGLSVVIEPRNASDEYVPLAGAVSVVVLDPSKAGEAARIARWNFDLSETGRKLQTSSATRGIQFQMPWPATPPQATALQLFVRFETPDGRRLQTDREIFLAEPGQLSQRWTPRPAERQRSAESVASAVLPLTQPLAAEPATVAVPQLIAPPAPPAWSPNR